MDSDLKQVIGDSPESQPLWSGLAAGRLVLQRCGACARVRFPPLADCPYCSAPGGEWETVEPHGTIYSWVVTHFPFDDAHASEVPYAVVTVALDCGPRIFARLTDFEPLDLRADRRVNGYFHEESGLPYLRFRPRRVPADG